MEKQVTNKIITKNKTSLGKRKIRTRRHAGGTDDLDSVIMSEPSKKIQKVTRLNPLLEPSFGIPKQRVVVGCTQLLY